MAQVQKGNTVRIHYTSALEDGTPVGSTEEAEPIEIQTGTGMVFPKLEQEMLGMHTGEVKSTTLLPEEAFGVYRRELVTDIGLEEFTSRGIEPYEGLTLDIPTQDGRTVQAKVTGISDQNVQLDANHPLAGHAITFSVQVLAIK